MSSTVKPSATVTVPAQSSLPDVGWSISTSERYDHTVPSSPSGTPTQKMALQSHSESTPPINSPRNEPATAAT
ncbi:Uncharacterised protein [Mycobacteroides abscessus subsp. abscessus]|nr:Uncharacterised protein [Mycobacteroides abscessus subsp. abscessus]